MKTFARVSIVIIYIIEVLCAITAAAGFLFKSLHLEGASQMLMLSFFLFGVIYFLVALIPYHKKLISDNPVFKQTPILILRRLLYFALGWLAFADLFYILNLDGRETLGFVVLTPLLILMAIAALLVFLDKERRHVFQWVFFRLIIFLIIYLKVVTLS